MNIQDPSGHCILIALLIYTVMIPIILLTSFEKKECSN